VCTVLSLGVFLEDDELFGFNLSEFFLGVIKTQFFYGVV
jgi:hypothetical protein